MQNLVFTQLSIPEIKQLFREELETYFSENKIGASTINEDEIGGIDLAVKITGKAKPTIYSLCSERKIPHSKQGKQLYFSRLELMEWLKQGKRKTTAEIADEAANFGQKNMETIQPTKAKNRFQSYKTRS